MQMSFNLSSEPQCLYNVKEMITGLSNLQLIQVKEGTSRMV